MLRALLALAFATAAALAQTPNVVVILVDDLGFVDLGCQGSTFYETPHIDGLAADGVRFTNGYAACAVCSPTRAAMMTGRSPARTGVTDWIRARFQRGGVGTPDANPTAYVGGPDRPLLCPPNPYWLELEERTIAEYLHDAGYATCHIGKWHLGDDAWYPEHQGFDENHGGCDYGQPPSYFDPYTNRQLPQGIPTLAPRDEGEYLTDREANIAADFIARHRDRPFFLNYAPYAVHTPIQAPEDETAEFAAKRDPNAGQRNAKYAAMVAAVDRAVGRILGALDAHGLTENTLVVFTSDNGGLEGPTDNAPLRSGKGFPYEGGIRVPWIVRWPGVVEPGRVDSTPVTTVDVLPTVLDAVGVTPDADRELDGTSLVPLLQGGELGRRPLFWQFPHYRGSVTPYAIVRDGRWKLIRRDEGPTFELFDLALDPGETRDLSARYPKQTAALAALLDDHLADVGARLPRANPAFVPKPRVLILGDSISMGYTQRVRARLANEAVVLRPTAANGRAENCEGTTKGVDAIDRWLAIDGGDFDVIHFNFGLHDIKRVDRETRRNSNDPSDPRQAEPEIYERQLRAIVAKLRATDAELVFATTTPVPTGGVRPHRDPADAVRYNAIARRVMAEAGIPVNDLFALVEPRLGELLPRPDVHFQAAGYDALADRVADAVRDAIARRAGR